MPKIKSHPVSNSLWLRQREMGMKFPLGHQDRFYKTLYSSIQPVTSWDHRNDLSTAQHGAVFNMEYSPDGSLLLAACEKQSILMFDPLCRRLIHTIDDAHSSCVNCVRFLDQHMFASCSDDSTVALWDTRNLKQKVRLLQGHSDWVKNIEYSAKDGLLLTSGFDGSIYTWDMNSFTENSFLHTRVFHTNGLMRTRLSPDASKMLICTTFGYIIIIHNLKLSTLSQDLAGFKPNMYRLMQLSQTTIPIAASCTHLFSHSRPHNRVEFLTDFPPGDDAEVISSLQIHPQGWCAMSRNISSKERSEWTCIHDIQEREEIPEVSDEIRETKEPSSEFNDLIMEESDDSRQLQPSRSGITSAFVIDSANRARDVPNVSDARSNLFVPNNASQFTTSSRANWSQLSWRDIQSRSPRSEGNATTTGLAEGESNFNPRSNTNHDNYSQYQSNENRNEDYSDDRESNGETRSTSQLNDLRRRNPSDNFSAANVELHVSSTDIWEALVTIREARLRREHERGANSGISVSLPRSSHTVVIIGDRLVRVQGHNRQAQQSMYAIPGNHKIHHNTPRLTHYIEEPNVGVGYIKELCFSADGRLICSPFGYGVRILAFSSECQELSNCVPPLNESVQLHEIATNISHSNIVVSTKFSPKHCLLVSGCLSGKIVWHQPVI